MVKSIAFAGMVTETKIRYLLTAKAHTPSASQFKLFKDGISVPLKSISSLDRTADSGFIETVEPLDIYGQYRLKISGWGEATVIPMDIFDSPYFAKYYHYHGTDLGAVVHGQNTTFKVWAPTASRVVLNLFTAGDTVDAYFRAEMVKGEKGVWKSTQNCGHGTYYTYTVTSCVGTQEAVDPYAKAAGVNGKRGMVVDLSRTDPEGWERTAYRSPLQRYSDAFIWEVHVKDFSNKIASSKYKGKYLAFTETSLVNEFGHSVGIDYLKELGITHVHLLPVYDYATVDEANPEKQFNWGYDPQNYNVPEGSYATDPYHGEVRIKEYKQMVMALHNAGIGVVMDMVYNHTYESNSNLNKIVPYYYYRYTPTGQNTSASCCGNDTASERYMFGKFMEESTAYWVSEYKLDGLRFDLMGLHDVATMQRVESAVHTVNPNAILYGEGWTMGATLDGSPQANQTNIHRVQPTGNAIGSIAVFNDVIRDGLKGSIFYHTSQGFINGAPKDSVRDVLFGIQGGELAEKGWAVENSMVINYMSAHDNHTLWDKLSISNPDASVEDRIRMNKLGAAIVMISKGTPFWQAGEELLRTKDGDDNSFRSGDAVNNIDWSVLKGGSRELGVMGYYKGLIQMRKAFSVFRDGSTQITSALEGGLLTVTFRNGSGVRAMAVINPENTVRSYTLEKEWDLVADDKCAGSAILARESGTVTIAPISIRIYIND